MVPILKLNTTLPWLQSKSETKPFECPTRRVDPERAKQAYFTYGASGFLRARHLSLPVDYAS